MLRGRTQSGFTLIEMLIVITVIGILMSIAIPSYRQSVLKAREAVLRENLYVLRSTIDQFTLDKKRAPTSLDELVAESYLRTIPRDIASSPGWRVENCDTLLDPDQIASGICDVHSGSDTLASDGTRYSSW
ncbi:MAG: type II secretion system protein [Terriglobia bacterium]